MGSWRKLLADMVADPRPRSYTYEQASGVLKHLGFKAAARKEGGSHRQWRLEIDDADGKRTVLIGLVQKGHGPMKRYLIEQMIDVLRANGLLPDEL